MAINTTGAMQGAALGSQMGPWGALAGGVAGGLGLFGDGGASAAAEAEKARQAQMMQMYQQQDPFSAGGNRAQYVPMLNQYAMGGPASVASDPAYQRFNQKSMDDLTRQMSARGQTQSGAEQVSLMQNSQNNMMDYWGKMMSTYADLSGASGGRTNPYQGMTGAEAGRMASDQNANAVEGFGGLMGGLYKIFGSGSGGGKQAWIGDYSANSNNMDYYG
jgi:hypothetical protein